MYSAVASGIFTARNLDKTANGDVGRAAVAYGQGAGLLQEIAKYDGAVANSAKSALSVFSKLSKESKVFEYAGKATKFAVNNVNPLICASGVIKTAMAEDKVKTGITEAMALSTMFAGEKLTKMHYDKIVNSKTCKSLINKASDMKILKPVFEYIKKHNLGGKIGKILKGVVFVGASIASYGVGQKIGDDFADKVKANTTSYKPKKINQKA